MYLTRLRNSASNCYMNSSLQGLSACPILIKDIKELARQNDQIETLQMFKKLLEDLTDGKTSEMNVRQNQLFKNWKKSGQQDSFELLSYVIGEVYNRLKTKSNLSNIDEWFQKRLPLRIIMKYEIKCYNEQCFYPVECPKQATLALHVPIPECTSNLSIQILVDKFMEESEIEDYVCDECSKSNATSNDKAKKYTSIISPLPYTICIHLQRTRWSKGTMKKIDDKIKIDEILKINYYENTEDKNAKPITETFNLKSVIVHSGTPFFGHYICYKKVNNIWYHTSDTSIKEVKTTTIPDCQAYILFYESLLNE